MNTQAYKEQLLAKAEELLHRSMTKEEIAIERHAEMLDEIQRAGEREIALETLSRNWKTVLEATQALRRIENDTYGVCQKCENPINERRLSAIPWAKFCITCQEKADRLEAGKFVMDSTEAA